MAEDKRISKRGVRAMLRPKPKRVRGCDPYVPIRPPRTGRISGWGNGHIKEA